jgi:hypothetical protein
VGAGVQFEVVVAFLELEEDAAVLDGEVFVEVGEEVAIYHCITTQFIYRTTELSIVCINLRMMSWIFKCDCYSA